jgi:hypothetical protein
MNIMKQLVKSIYSPSDIAKFRIQGIGRTILFVFFLTLISALPTTYYFTKVINDGLQATHDTFIEDLPPFVIENGLLSVKSSTPLIIEKNDFKVILDGGGTIDQYNLEDTENAIVLLKHEFLFLAGGNKQPYSYTMLGDTKITNQDLVDFLNTMDGLKYIFLPIMFLIIFIFSSGIKFIEVSILALIGIAIVSFFKKNVPYRQLWRMAAYSVTLPTVFFTIMAIFQISVPNGFLLNWFVSIMVLTLAIKEIPMKKKKV